MTYLPEDGDDWEIPDFGLGAPVTADDSLDYLAEPAPASAADGEHQLAMFSVSNPAGSVTATASIAGLLHRIELGGTAHSMTETELAQEILLVGRLAGQKARSELFTHLVNRTAEEGQDAIATARFLADDVGLPTPEESAAAQADAFGALYLESHG